MVSLLDSEQAGRKTTARTHPPVPFNARTRYLDLLRSSLRVCELLQQHAAAAAPAVHPPPPSAAQSGGRAWGPRVALMTEPGPGYVAGTWGTWLHRGISVPLCLTHPDRCGQGSASWQAWPLRTLLALTACAA